MSKGNDKNVGSIEEDIKRLENYLKDSAYKQTDSDFFKNGGWEIVDLKIPRAIEHLLQDYTRQEQINEEHQKINGELREKVKELEDKYILEKVAKEEVEELLEDSIPKQKIKNLMEKEKLPLTIVGGRNNSKTLAYGIRLGKIKACEELLQESEYK